MPVIQENSASIMETDSSSSLDVCRLCAESYDSRSCIPLYMNDKRERIIAKQINQLVVNLVSPDDGLPQKICLKCAKNVEMCYSFVCSVIETQNKLKRLKRATVLEDQKSKSVSDDEFMQNNRWENITLNDYDNGLNTAKRSISKSSVYPTKTKANTINHSQPHSSLIDIDCEQSVPMGNTRSAPAAASKTNKTPTTTSHSSFKQSPSLSQLQSRLPKSTAVADPKSNSPSCLFRCGVCLEKFPTKDECIRHMMSSHTPPSSVSLAKDTSDLVGFDVVCKNGGGEDASSIHNNNHKSKQRKSVSPVPFSSSVKSRRKILNIDSFYKEMKKNCTRYRCDVCGRLMASWFAFKRHLREHRETDNAASKSADNCDRAIAKSSAVGVIPKPSIGYCKKCNRLVKHFKRHDIYHAIIKSYDRLKCEDMTTTQRDSGCITNGDGSNDDHLCQNERKSNTAMVDDFIELLVVHSDDIVEVDVNGMLNGSQNFIQVEQQPQPQQHQQVEMSRNVDSTATPLLLSSSQFDTSFECLKEVKSPNGQRRLANKQETRQMDCIATNDYDYDDNVMTDSSTAMTIAVIKEEPKEMTAEAEFCDDYENEILEFQEEPQVTWVYDDATKVETLIEDECDIVYKCESCGNTYENETLFQSHICESYDEGADDTIDSAKSRTVFQCDVCDRIFKSKFVFKMHYAQHKKSNICQLCNACFLDSEDLRTHFHQAHAANADCLFEDNAAVYEEVMAIVDSEKQCDVCGKITDNLKQHKLYHAIKELEYCKAENKKFLKKWFYCQKCDKKIFSEANYLFHVAKHNGQDTVGCAQCDFVAVNIQEYNMHITTHTGGKYFICNDCEKCFFTRSAISDHVLIHMDGTRYMCEICGKRFKTSRSNAQHKLLQHKKYFRCNRCNRGFTHEAKLKSHYNICRVINQDHKESKVFEPVEKFFCNICNSNIKSSSEISILFHKAKHEGKDGVACKFCNLLCKNACMYKNHLLIHTNQRPYSCTQCPKSFRTKGCLVQHMLVHGDEYKYTCEYCGKKSKKLTTHVNHVNIHTNTKPYKCPDCDRPFRQLSDMKKHRRTHLKYKAEPAGGVSAGSGIGVVSNSAASTGFGSGSESGAVTAVTVTTRLPYLTIKTEVEDMIAAESIQQVQLA